MKYIREIFRNIALSKFLKPKYYNISGTVGLVGVCIGIAISVSMGNLLANIFAIDLDKSIGGTGLEFFYVAGVLVYFIFCLVVGCLIVASIFSTYMYLTKQMSKEEAIWYALLSRYPAH